jgi:hypothetical protein
VLVLHACNMMPYNDNFTNLLQILYKFHCTVPNLMHVERPVNRDYTVIAILCVVILLLIIIVISMSNLVSYHQEEAQAKKSSSSNKESTLIELPQEGKQISFSSPSFPGTKVLFKQVKNDTTGNWIINGKIKNTGVDTLSYLKIIAYVYDSQKQMVGVADTYADKQDLYPGQASSFTIYVSAKNLTSSNDYVKYYSLRVESA